MINTRADSVKAARRHPAGRGGSIPASALFFHPEQRDDADALVKKYHYSHRLPGSVQFVGTLYTKGGLFGTRGTCVAACYFSSPPTRWSKPVLELSRLVRHDDYRVPLTMLVALSCRHLRNEGVGLVVSFADATQGHHGGVYQACGWCYHGQRKEANDGVVIDGMFYPGRTCNATWGTRSPAKLRKLMANKCIEPHYDDGKHLYWKSFTKSGAQDAASLSLQAQPYPKPEQ